MGLGLRQMARMEYIKGAVTQADAERRAPWAEAFLAIEGGYMAYECAEDAAEIGPDPRVVPARLPANIRAIFKK